MHDLDENQSLKIDLSINEEVEFIKNLCRNSRKIPNIKTLEIVTKNSQFTLSTDILTNILPSKVESFIFSNFEAKYFSEKQLINDYSKALEILKKIKIDTTSFNGWIFDNSESTSAIINGWMNTSLLEFSNCNFSFTSKLSLIQNGVSSIKRIKFWNWDLWPKFEDSEILNAIFSSSIFYSIDTLSVWDYMIDSSKLQDYKLYNLILKVKLCINRI